MTKKSKPKNKKPSQKWLKYKLEGNTILKSKKCPKCNVFLADHKDRFTCGKCNYTEFKKK